MDNDLMEKLVDFRKQMEYKDNYAVKKKIGCASLTCIFQLF